MTAFFVAVTGDIIRACVALLAVATSLVAGAHEFWLHAQPFAPPAGGSARLTLWVGENFAGDQVAFSAEHTAALRRYTQESSEDLLGRTQLTKARADIRLEVAKSGTHLLAFDSRPALITLAADKFHAYLHDEGLDAIVRQREAAGNAALLGRERYRRCARCFQPVYLHPGYRGFGCHRV